VTISLKSQTKRLAAEEVNRVEVIAGDRDKATGFTLLDTCALAGNFLSHKMVDKLNASNYVYKLKTACNVCNGLNNSCYPVNEMLDVILTFINESNNIQRSIPISCFISRNAAVDVILGRATVKKFNFFHTHPIHFVLNTAE
jgi:hypothetical protein